MVDFYREAMRRIANCRRENCRASAPLAPWRDGATSASGLKFSTDGTATRNRGEEDPRAAIHIVSPGFFATLGCRWSLAAISTIPTAGRSEPVAIVSQTVASDCFRTGMRSITT